MTDWLTWDSLEDVESEIIGLQMFSEQLIYMYTEELGKIAGRYGNGKCDKAVKAMAGYLTKKKQKFEIIEVRFSGLNDRNYVVSDIHGDEAIGDNGFHMGVVYMGIAYCNIHPYGLPEKKWIDDFHGLGIKTVTKIPIPLP